MAQQLTATSSPAVAAPRRAALPPFSAAVAVAVMFAVLFGGLPLGWLIALTCLVAVALPSWTGPTSLWRLPAAATAVIAGVSGVGIVCAALGFPWLAERFVALPTALVALAVAAWTAYRRATRGQRDATDSRDRVSQVAGRAAAIPALVIAGLASLLWLRRGVPFDWFYRLHDNISHVYFADLTMREGLDYSAASYPRGIHATLAWAMGAFGPSEPRERLDAWTELWVGFQLASYLLLILAVLFVAVLVLRQLTAPAWSSWVAAAVATAGCLAEAGFGSTFTYGFATTPAAVWMGLALVITASATAVDPVRLLAAASVATAALANAWQALLPITVVPLIWSLWQTWRARASLTGKVAIAVGFVAVGAAITAVVPVVAVVPRFLGGMLSETGSVAGLQPITAAAALVCLFVLIVLARRHGNVPSWLMLWVASVCALIATTLAFIGLSGSATNEAGYYFPRKMLWFVLALASPALVAVITSLSCRLIGWLRSQPRRVAVLVGSVAGVALTGVVGAFALTQFTSVVTLVTKASSEVPPRTVVVSAETQKVLGAGSPVVVWIRESANNGTQTAVYANLMLTMWPHSGLTSAASLSRDPAGLCQHLRDQPNTTVLTRNPDDLRRELLAAGCASPILVPIDDAGNWVHR